MRTTRFSFSFTTSTTWGPAPAAARRRTTESRAATSTASRGNRSVGVPPDERLYEIDRIQEAGHGGESPPVHPRRNRSGRGAHGAAARRVGSGARHLESDAGRLHHDDDAVHISGRGRLAGLRAKRCSSTAAAARASSGRRTRAESNADGRRADARDGSADVGDASRNVTLMGAVARGKIRRRCSRITSAMRRRCSPRCADCDARPARRIDRRVPRLLPRARPRHGAFNHRTNSGGARDLPPTVDLIMSLAHEFPRVAYVKKKTAPLVERTRTEVNSGRR